LRLGAMCSALRVQSVPGSRAEQSRAEQTKDRPRRRLDRQIDMVCMCTAWHGTAWHGMVHQRLARLGRYLWRDQQDKFKFICVTCRALEFWCCLCKHHVSTCCILPHTCRLDGKMHEHVIHQCNVGWGAAASFNSNPSWCARRVE